MPDDLSSFQKQLGELPMKMKRQLATAIKAEAERLTSAIKAAAPVKSGALRDSVQVRRRKNDLDLEVTAGGDATTREVRGGSGVQYDYALAAEYGTAKESAQPFFYPTVRAMEREIHDNIEEAIAEALK